MQNIPAAPDIEAAVLGTVIESASEKLLRQLSIGLFNDVRHRAVFDALVALDNSHLSLDNVTLAQWLMDKGKMEAAGGPAFVSGLPEKSGGMLAFPSYLATLKEKSNRRQLLMLSEKAKNLAKDQSIDPQALIDEFSQLSKHILSSGVRREWLHLRSPKELREWQAPQDWILAGDTHITRGNITILAGPPGCGKSRAVNWLSVLGARGEGNWFGLEIKSKFRTAIIQAENGPYRLKQDFLDVKARDLDKYVRVTEPPEYGFQFQNPEFREYVADLLSEFEPDIIALDPWNRIVGDDSARDFTEGLDYLRETFRKLKKPPAILIVHHFKKGDGSERWSVRGLLDKLSGSYTLGAGARCVLGMVHASDEASEDRIAFICTKNNDGALGERTAWHRRGHFFQKCEDFDWAEFETPPEPGGPKIMQADLEKLFEGGKVRLVRREAVKRLTEPPFGFRKTAAYTALLTTPDGRFSAHLREESSLLIWSSVPNLQPDLIKG